MSILIGFRALSQTKNSLKETMLPGTIGLSVLFTSVFGFKIGSGLDNQSYIEECLGIDKMIIEKR